jgi:hypothetical protein
MAEQLGRRTNNLDATLPNRPKEVYRRKVQTRGAALAPPLPASLPRQLDAATVGSVFSSSPINLR